MGTKKTVVLIGCVCAILLMGFILLLNGKREAPTGESIASSLPSTTPLLETIEPIETAGQPTVGEFRLDVREPHILWKNGRSSLYVQNLQLYSLTDGAEAVSLYEWTEPLVAEAWLNGDRLLIGVQAKERDTSQLAMGQGMPGHWLGLRVGAEPVVDYDETTFFGPREVLQMVAAENPRLFIATVVNGEAYSEHLLDPAHDNWISVYRGRLDPLQAGFNKQQGMRDVTEGRVFNLADGSTIRTYADNGDTMLYSEAPFLFARRYVDLELLDLKQIDSLHASHQLLGRFRSEAGGEVMMFLNGGYDDTPIPIEPRIWEEDWQVLAPYSLTFMQAMPDKLEILQFAETDLEDGRKQIGEPTLTSYSTAGSRLLASQGSLLTYEAGSGKKQISWHDLVHARAQSGSPIWLTPMEDYESRTEIRPNPDSDWSKPRVPAIAYEEANTNAEIPEELGRAMDEVLMDSDYGYGKTYRLIDGRWYVLYDDHFFVYEDGALRKIGDMPVTISVSIDAGAGGRTARDFARVDESWIVADTEGSRVLKLDDNLQIRAEVAVPTPYRLSFEGNQLTVASEGSLITIDSSFTLKGKKPLAFQSTAKKRYEAEKYFRPQQYTEDKENGLTWYYYDGNLYQYRDQEKELRSFFVGYNENFAGTVRIIPYRDEMLVMLDRRLERFDRQGNWLSRIEFPRSQPDGIYDRTPHGENSTVLDEARGVLYLVQGYRIVAIDLQRNGVREAFRQNHSDIGKPIRYKDDLYVLLHSNENDRYEQRSGDSAAYGPFYTEIVKLGMLDSSQKRFIVEGFHEDMEVREGANGKPAFILKSYSN
ncbi:hypothetical protein RB620_17715 [Paenibacillus sp. LHD-117]|uniref:hypothetical protein n=1 Tax=Paenibacillus sp. LHD-117 TaxID=3071412 RepID=UPI0027DF6A1D|nr:hypothetical protein [Paenibacillus sp. LHD-117]MDQ6421265.1 hypothetical protein [Paenibacillus sp. LHD-117]